MQTKPYSLQSPEAIAKEYAGNKQKIAQAMQMGIVDPTAGVLAGMFIDRMRSAQAQEMAPQPSVAQQVMGGAPQAPVPPSSGGLGMTRPAQPSMAPQGGVGMAPPPPEMQAMPGMAAGGLYEAPYMKDGGLSEIPLPDTMFDENRDGSYAGGGIVAFATGDEVEELEETVVTGKRPQGEIDPTAGLGKTYAEQMGLIKQYAPQKNKYGEKVTSFYEEIMSPEAQKKRKKEDLWASLAELGFGMASSKSPTLFGAIGEAGAKAAPGMAARGKERREEQRDAIKTLAAREDVSNKQAMEAFGLASELQKAYAGLLDNKAKRALDERMNNADNATQILAQRIAANATMGAAAINRSGYIDAENLKNQRIMMQASTAVAKEVDSALAGRAGAAKQPLLYNMTYQQAQQKNPELAAKFRDRLISQGVNKYLTGFSDSDPLGLND